MIVVHIVGGSGCVVSRILIAGVIEVASVGCRWVRCIVQILIVRMHILAGVI